MDIKIFLTTICAALMMIGCRSEFDRIVDGMKSDGSLNKFPSDCNKIKVGATSDRLPLNTIALEEKADVVFWTILFSFFLRSVCSALMASKKKLARRNFLC